MKFKSIVSRIILSVVPIVAIFTFISVVMIYNTMNEQVNTQFSERMNEGLGFAKLSIYTELMLNADIARSLAIYAETCTLASIENKELRHFLLETIPSNKNTVGGGIWFEPYYLYANQRYWGPYVYVKDGQAIYAPEYSNEVDYHSAEWYLNGKNSNNSIVWSDVYYDPVAGVNMITASMPFYKNNGVFSGVTTADMALTDIKAISSSISVGKTGAAFILGARGEFISFIDGSRTIDMLIQDDSDEGLAALGEMVLSADSGSMSVKWNGTIRRAFFTNIEETGWHLVVMIDIDEVGQSANALITLLAFVPLAGLLLVTISIVLLARYLKRVANKVNRLADKGASGDLSERILITEYDEFGVMEDRLNTMMDNMAEMTERSERMLEMAHAANKAKTEFLSKMSHEMRTPMNAIIGMVQIAEKSNENTRIRDCLDKINHASKNLLELINNVLDMAKIEANKIELDVVRVSIKDMFESIAKVFWVKADEKHLVLTMYVDEAIPENIWNDRFRYSQIVTNLISNAIKFTPPGGEIIVSARLLAETANNVIIETAVKDTGIGVAPEAVAKLFLSFEQADSSISRKYGGTGLGLSISKSLVELMGGQIWFEPNSLGGSSFVFTIEAAKTGKADIAPVSVKTIKDYDFTSNHILIAEDVEVNREIVAALLEDTGINIDFAENGLEACEKFAAAPQKYDLIFMDIQMPEMDGLTAAREIRRTEQGRRTPIIAMSANAFKDDVEASIDAGMDGHISKPINVNAVLNTLETWLSGNKAEKNAG